MILEDSNEIPSADKYVILGVTIDNRLTFYNHLKNFCKKIANKLNALTRIGPYLTHNQIRLIYNSFFKGQLRYCPLIWIFFSRRSNHLVNKLQERALRIASNDFNSSFSELLEMANESTKHARNLKFLLNEVHKFLNGLSPPIMKEMFQTNDCPYDLRNPRILASKHKSTIKYGINTIAFRGSQIWQNIPSEIRNSESLSLFKSNIKQIQSLPYRCKICRLFIANLAYID